MMSVSPSGQLSIAHSGRQGSRTLISTKENRVSSAARPTVSGYLPIQRKHLSVQGEELERLRPLLSRLEGNRHFLVVQGRFGDHDVIRHGLGLLQILCTHLTDRLAEGSRKPLLHLLRVPEFQVYGKGSMGRRHDRVPKRNRILDEDVRLHDLCPSPIQLTPVDPPGIEPGFPPRQGGVVPLDHRPARFSGPGGGRTHLTDLARISRRHGTSQPRGPSGSRTRSSSLPRRGAAETPTDHFFSSDPGWSRTSTFSG